jgi:hypothetical protein
MNTLSENLVVEYGCPICQPRKEPTGEYFDSIKFMQETGIKWTFLKLFGRIPPTKKVSIKEPKYLYVFDLKPIALPMDTTEPYPLECPYCGATGWIKILGGKLNIIDWRYKHKDGSISRYMVRDCRICHTKLSVYLRMESQDSNYWGRCLNPECAKTDYLGA